MSSQPRQPFPGWQTLFFSGVILAVILRFVPFSWDIAIISLLAGASLEYVYGMYNRSPWDRVAGWLWPPCPVFVGNHCSDGRWRQYKLSNTSSMLDTVLTRLCGELGINLEEVRAEARGGRFEGSSSQVLAMPSPPPPEEYGIDDFSVEGIFGTCRGRVRFRGFIVVKPNSQPLASKYFCSSSIRRRRMRYHLTLMRSQYLGVHYAPGFGRVHLHFAITELAGEIPPYLLDWMEKVAKIYTDLAPQMIHLRMEALKTQGLKEQVKLYKGLHEDSIKQVSDIRSDMERLKFISQEVEIPSPRQKLMEKTPVQKIVEVQPGRKFDFRWLLLLAVAFLPGYVLYDSISKTPIAEYPWLTPNVDLLIGIAIFAAIMIIGRRKLKL